MYEIIIKKEADKIFAKLQNKNPNQWEIILKKIEQISKNPYHEHKFLKKPMQNFNRVHIDKHFVLIFKINHERREVEIFNFEHHDFVYKKEK